MIRTLVLLLTASTTLLPIGPAADNYAVAFDPTASSALIGPTAGPRLTNPGRMTIAIRYKRPTIPPTGFAELYSKYDATSVVGWYANYSAAFGLAIGVPNNNGGVSDRLHFSIPNAGVWVRECHVFNMQLTETEKIRLYRAEGDAVTMADIQGTRPSGSTLPSWVRGAPAAPWTIGGRETSNFGDAVVSDFLFVDAELSLSECSALWNTATTPVKLVDLRQHSRWYWMRMWVTFGDAGGDTIASGGTVRDIIGAARFIPAGLTTAARVSAN